MKITSDLILDGMSDSEGWNSGQLNLLGVPWPPPKGWRKEVIGRFISDSDAARFLELKNHSFRKGRFRKRVKSEPVPESEPSKKEHGLPKVTIHTDGSCLRQGKAGAWSFLRNCPMGEMMKSMAYRKTTNNRMEIMAAIAGLKSLETKSHVILYSDSQYLVKGIARGWAASWQRKGWRVGVAGKRPNWDLWELLLSLCEDHKVEFLWIRGHNGNKGNEKCDELAYRAVKEGPWLDDLIFERIQTENGGKW